LEVDTPEDLQQVEIYLRQAGEERQEDAGG